MKPTVHFNVPGRLLPVPAMMILLAATPAFAQDAKPPEPTGFWLTTPYPELALQPGEKESIPLTLRNSNLPPQRARIELSGMPADWQWTLEGGGHEVSAAIVEPNDTESLTLRITASSAAADKSYPIEVTAHYGDKVVNLPINVRISKAAPEGVTLTPQLPALRGNAKSTFSYKVKVTNEGTEDALFNLLAQVPDGFETRFKKGYGSEEITGLPVKAGASTDLTVEVVPPHAVPAGRYPIKLHVGDGENSAEAELSLEVTGQPELTLVGPQERLSGSAVAGRDTSFNFTVANTGSAPVDDLTFRASPPQGWKVTYDPEKISVLPPETKKEVNVTIHPSERAIDGDYMVNLTASSGSASDTARFRVTVQTATVWGMAGLGVIAASVAVLGMAIMRYGRR